MIFNERGGATRTVAAWTSLFLMFSVIAMGTVLANTVSDTGFEIEGNLVVGENIDILTRTPIDDGLYDWGIGDGAGGSVILGDPTDANNNGDLWDGGDGKLIVDGHSKAGGDPSIFSPSGKFNQPENWNVTDGQNPGQNELTNVYVWAVSPGEVGNTDLWINMGMERVKKTGTFDLDFEFNQEAWLDPFAGGPTRTDGDVVVAFELSGNPEDPQADLEVIVLVYEDGLEPLIPNNRCGGILTGGGGKILAVGQGSSECPRYGDSNFFYRFRGLAAALGDIGVATMNGEPIAAGAWGSLDSQGKARTEIPAFEFAEAAINLTYLGLDPGCPGFGSVHAKSRSSIEATADLKDLAGPAQLPIDCFISGYKWHDKDADGLYEADGSDLDPATLVDNEERLDGWSVSLYKDAPTGTPVATVETGAGLWPDGYYEFAIPADGTYYVVESCDSFPSWFQSFPDPTNGCGSGIHGPIIINATTPISENNDFGNYTTATKSGMKFLDIDTDGIKDTDEPGLPGWTIFVDQNGDGVHDPDGVDDILGNADDELSAKTGGDGTYTITGILPGTYNVNEVLQEGWTCSFPNTYPYGSGPDPVKLDAGADCKYTETFLSGDSLTGNDFGNWTVGYIEGTKFKDVDNDGVLDTEDVSRPLEGWTIFIDLNGDGLFDPDGLDNEVGTDDDELSDVTDANGDYSIEVDPGTYTICEVQMTNWLQSYPFGNTLCGLEAGHSVSVGAGQTVSDVDFLNAPEAYFDVRFFDLTGSTDATIECVEGVADVPGTDFTVEPDDPDYTEGIDPETTFTSDNLPVGTYTCTIVITDP